MKKLYESPKTEVVICASASFLSTSGEVGDAVAIDTFESDYGANF